MWQRRWDIEFLWAGRLFPVPLPVPLPVPDSLPFASRVASGASRRPPYLSLRDCLSPKLGARLFGILQVEMPPRSVLGVACGLRPRGCTQAPRHPSRPSQTTAAGFPLSTHDHGRRMGGFILRSCSARLTQASSRERPPGATLTTSHRYNDTLPCQNRGVRSRIPDQANRRVSRRRNIPRAEDCHRNHDRNTRDPCKSPSRRY